MVFKYLVKATTTLIIGIIRGKAIAPLLIAIVIPSAIATVFLLAVNVLNSQSNMVIESYIGKSSLIYSKTPLDNTSCVRVFVGNVIVKTFNETFEAQVHVVNDFRKYIEINGLRIISSSEKDSKIIVSIGQLIARRYSLGLGSKISICINGKCYSGNITHIHHGNKYLDYVIIVSGIEYDSGKSQYLCRVESNWILTSIIRDLGSSTLYAMWFLSLFTLAAYFPILYLALNKTLAILREEVKILHGIGLSRSCIQYSFIIACSFLCLLLVLYGISIGTLLVHLSTWLLRFFGIIVIEKPALSLNMLSLLTIAFLITVIVEASIASRRIGDFIWSGL